MNRDKVWVFKSSLPIPYTTHKADAWYVHAVAVTYRQAMDELLKKTTWRDLSGVQHHTTYLELHSIHAIGTEWWKLLT